MNSPAPPSGQSPLDQPAESIGVLGDLTSGLQEHVVLVKPKIEVLRRRHRFTHLDISGEVFRLEARLKHERRLRAAPRAENENQGKLGQRPPPLDAGRR